VRLDVTLPSTAASGTEAVDRCSPLPLYAQIARRLAAELPLSSAEARFYGDEEAAARFDVSRMTARQAIQQLVDEGLRVGLQIGGPKFHDATLLALGARALPQEA
jgi:hypothetical protein